MSWFILALLSPLFWGIENLLYKVSARKRHNSDLVGIIFLGAALAGCLVMQVVTRAVWTQIPLTVGICLVYSLCYLLVIQSRFEALKHVDVNFFFPVTKVGSLIILIVFVWIYGLCQRLIQ